MVDKNMVGTVPGDESLGADDCLGLIGDIIAKVRKGKLTKRNLQLFAERLNPFFVPTDLTVNDGDTRWEEIRTQDYFVVDGDVRVADFPLVQLGIHDVAYDVGSFDHDPTTREVEDWQCAPGFRPADRSEAETYIDNLPDSTKQFGESPVVSLCGKVANGFVACVYIDNCGRYLDKSRLDNWWDRNSRFLRVRITE